MSRIRLRSWTAPLLYREIVLRILLASTLSNILINTLVFPGVGPHNTSISFWFTNLIVPLSIILHHVLRLWPRRCWLVVCEALLSLVEVGAGGAVLVRNAVISLLSIIDGNDPGHVSGEVLRATSCLIISTSSLIAAFFLLCDILHEKNLLRPYDFSAGLCQPNHQWNLIFGQFTTRKRFSTDNLFIRCVRGGLAILCLLAVSYLAVYAIIWQPLQWSGRPGIKTFKIPVTAGEFGSTLDNLIGRQEKRLIYAVFEPRIEPSAVNMSLTKKFRPSAVQCTQDFSPIGAILTCPHDATPIYFGELSELLITIHFPPDAHHDLQINLGMTDSPSDVYADSEPIFLGPGSNIHGLSSILVRERFSGQRAAAFGVPQYYRFAVINWDIEIEQEYLEGSVLNGFALVGGAWTLINGIFAAIFGTTLLLILFGIKPLSIYGLVHYFRRGRASLVDRAYVLPPEERDHIVGILREHLMDMGGVEEGQNSSPHYGPTDILKIYAQDPNPKESAVNLDQSSAGRSVIKSSNHKGGCQVDAGDGVKKTIVCKQHPADILAVVVDPPPLAPARLDACADCAVDGGRLKISH